MVTSAPESTGAIEVDADDALLHCQVAGDGPLVICAHGFPDCARSFRGQLPALIAAGFRVALVTMRGYAPSTRSRRDRYDVASLGRDLMAVADTLSPHRRVALVGHDWGAIASYAASAARPERIAALATLAVPHWRALGPRFVRAAQLFRSRYIAELQLPGAAERVRAGNFAFIDRLWRAWSPGFHCPPEEMAQIKAGLDPALDAVIGYYRGLRPAGLWAARRLLLAPTRVPGLYLHGADDGCIGAELATGLRAAYLGEFHGEVLDGAGHFLHLEVPDRVNAVLLPFLARHLR